MTEKDRNKCLSITPAGEETAANKEIEEAESNLTKPNHLIFSGAGLISAAKVGT